jgi:uncharacterized protein
MNRNPFDPTYESLPARLPIFPLAGVLLLPRGRLPLNVFEPRYLAMATDALGGDRMIGMVQTVDPAIHDGKPTVFETGCAGRITNFAETDDGRFLITLTGVSRFRIARELDGNTPYRTVEPDWSEFSGDLEPPPDAGLDRCRLLGSLKHYFKIHGISANWRDIECSKEERLIHALSMICPFTPGEKQALLEAPDIAHRARLLIAIVEMAILDQRGGDVAAH